jgi:hypothetical protein
MLRHEGYGAYFRTAITGTTISFVGYAFVDDTDTQSPDDTEGDVAHRMQEEGIRASGFRRCNCPGEGSSVPYRFYLATRQLEIRYAEAPVQLRVRDCNRDGRRPWGEIGTRR